MTTTQLAMEDDAIVKAMLGMGWDPGSAIPMANEENARLLKELDDLTEKKAQFKERLQETEERVEKIQQHSKNAEGSIEHNLKLLHAYQSEVRTETHLCKLAEREHSKLKEDMKNNEKELNDMTKLIEVTEKELCKRKRSIDEKTNRIKWAKAALVEWEAAMQDGQKGYQLIEKYCAEDQAKAKQLEHRRQMLQDEIEKNRKELIAMYDEQKSLEQTLNATATLYRSAHTERRQMVDTWKLAVQQMTQREREIVQGEERLSALKVESKKTADERKQHDTQLNEIIQKNSQVETDIEQLNVETSEIKEQIQKLTDMVALKENEVELLQKDLQNLFNRVQQQRFENRQHAKEKTKKLEELQNFEEVLRQLEERYAAMESKNTNANQRRQILEDMNTAEEKAQSELNKETSRLNDLIYRTQQQLAKFKSEEKATKINNDGIKVAIQAIKKNMSNNEKELKKKTEMHYELAFKCLQIERRIIVQQGGVIEPEVEQRNKEILAKLEEQLATVLKRVQSIEAQNKKLDDTMRKLTNCFNEDNKELEVMHFKIKEAQVYCEGGIKRLKAETQTNQVLIVELSILKMRANEFENEIAKCEDSTYNLEKHRMQLNRTIKDRMVEIKSQIDLLTLKRKHLNEVRSTLRADVAERNRQLAAVQARFELTSKLLGVNEDGSSVTPTQLKVESAQEEQLLLEEGNQLNERVLKAEEEIKAMENTVMLMNGSNDIYRKKVQKQTDDEEALNELNGLKSNYCKALQRLKQLSNKILCIEQSNERALKEQEELEKTLEMETRKRMDSYDVLAKLQKELDDQQVKMKRAERDIKVVLKRVKQRAISEDFLALYDQELDLRELEQRNTNALNQLADLADNDDEIGPKIRRLMVDKGLELPHQTRKSRSFVSWRSDVSNMSYSSSKDLAHSTSRSSVSEGSNLRLEASSTRLSVISLDFPGSK